MPPPMPGGPEGPGMQQMIRRMPLFLTLDMNEDGEISEAEIDAAIISLKKLDKNGDRKLTMDELRPQFGPPGGPAMGPPPGGPGFAGGNGPMERSGNLKRFFAARDADGDGKLRGDEIPPQFAERLERLDTNGDQALDEEEMKAAGERFGGRPREGRPEQNPDGSGVPPKRPAESPASDAPQE